jgi:hypothetical protein
VAEGGRGRQEPIRPDPGGTLVCPQGGIVSRVARRGIEPSDKLGRHRDVVERSLVWLVGPRRLQVRHERRGDVLLGFLELACALLCLNCLKWW